MLRSIQAGIIVIYSVKHITKVLGTMWELMEWTAYLPERRKTTGLTDQQVDPLLAKMMITESQSNFQPRETFLSGEDPFIRTS